MNLAMIGLGMVAATHLNAIKANTKGLTLRGVCSRDAGKAAAFIEAHMPDAADAVRIYNSVDEIAGDAAIDFVIVATPPNARADIIGKLVAAGKHILLEKPIERDWKAASAIVEQCEAAGVTLGIVFQHRAREVSQKLRALLGSGETGPIRIAEIAVPWWRAQSYYDEPGRGTYARDGGGVLISQAIHTMDLALSFTGAVKKVQAMARTSALHNMEAEDFVTAGLDFESGAIGSLTASTASYPGSAESITLHCEHVSVCLKSGKLDLHWQDGRTETIGEDMASGGGADPMAFTHEWHQAVIEDFADAIRSGRPPIAPGREALAVHRLIGALALSSRTERAVTLSELDDTDD